MIGEMARGCYSMEMFETADALDANSVPLVQLLREHHDLNLRMIPADNLPAAGYA